MIDIFILQKSLALASANHMLTKFATL